MTIESDQRAVGRSQTSRVSSPNVFPASNSSIPNHRLFFDDEDLVRNLRDTANSRPQNSGPTTTREEPVEAGHVRAVAPHDAGKRGLEPPVLPASADQASGLPVDGGETPDIHGQKLIIEELKKKKTFSSRLGCIY